MEDVWMNAPIWAKWASFDKDGIWHWFESKPSPMHSQWYCYHRYKCVEYPPTLQAGDNWQTSLIERPFGVI